MHSKYLCRYILEILVKKYYVSMEKILRFRKSKHYVSANYCLFRQPGNKSITCCPLLTNEEVEVGLRAGYYLCALKIIIKM